MERWGEKKQQLWARQTLRLGCISFFPPQCECIIVWAVPVRNDNRGWHWKVPEFSCLKMSLGWLWQNATQGDGWDVTKTTTLKRHRSRAHTHTHTHTRTRSWKCAYALLLLPSITQMDSSFRCHFILSIQTAERINVSSISVFFLNIMIDWIFVGGWTVLAEKNGQKRQQISRCHLQSEWPFFSVGSCIKNTYLIDQKNSRQINKWWCTSVVCCSLMILHSFLFML